MRSARSLCFILSLALLILFSPVYSQVIPKPKEVLGFEVGADYHLATYTQAVEYFKRLAENSSRIQLFEMGETSMGLKMIYAAISSPENLAELDRYKTISRRMS